MAKLMPRTIAGRFAFALGAAVLLLLVVSQLFLAGLGERALEERLTKNGGIADVELSAFPAARLLWGKGTRIAVEASGLDLDLADSENDSEVFDDLDRFDNVEIRVDESKAGPFKLTSLILARHGLDQTYSLDVRGSASAADLARYGIDRGGLPGSGIVGTILDFTGIGGADIPVTLDMELDSDGGQIEVVSGGGEIAGFPTGPLAELVTKAITIRL